MIGAKPMTVIAAHLLVERGQEVVIVESDAEVIERLSENIDCAFVHGDGSKPTVLREVGVGQGDFLFCLTDDDQTNILAALVGRSLEAARIVPKVEDTELEALCKELGLQDVIVPNRTTAQALADLVTGGHGISPASVLKHQARFFSFTFREAEPRAVSELDLPKRTGVVCIYRGRELVLPQDSSEVQNGDEVVLIAHASSLPHLAERWAENQGQVPDVR